MKQAGRDVHSGSLGRKADVFRRTLGIDPAGRARLVIRHTIMEPTTTAYGTWSGGRFMHFGETLSEERFIGCIETAYESGIRTFVTSDVYGNGKADELLGRALKGIDRGSYSLVGMIGHDFYEGQRQGSRGYPRFTDPELRGPEKYARLHPHGRLQGTRTLRQRPFRSPDAPQSR